MKRNLLTAIALGSGAVLCASGASAVTTISIGDCMGAGCIPTIIAAGSGSVSIPALRLEQPGPSQQVQLEARRSRQLHWTPTPSLSRPPAVARRKSL